MPLILLGSLLVSSAHSPSPSVRPPRAPIRLHDMGTPATAVASFHSTDVRSVQLSLIPSEPVPSSACTTTTYALHRTVDGQRAAGPDWAPPRRWPPASCWAHRAPFQQSCQRHPRSIAP